MTPEDVLALRVEDLRRAKDMTYEELSAAMSQAGCPTWPSALQKIEKAVPRRKIRVNELVAFAAVFELPVTDLLDPDKVTPPMPLEEAFAEWAEESSELAHAAATHRYSPEIASILSGATMTVEEFGQVVGVGLRQAYLFVGEGHIKSLRIGKRIVVPTKAVLAFLEGTDSNGR